MYSDEVWNKSIAISKQIINEDRKRNESCMIAIRDVIRRVWTDYNNDDTIINNILNFEKAGGEIVRVEDPLILRRSGDICYRAVFEKSYCTIVFDINDI